MNNSTAPLQGELLLITQIELVIPTTLAGTLYGVAFTLFCLYVHSLVSQLQDEDRKRRAKFMLGYSVVIMLCGLYDLVANAWVIQEAYIKHGDYPGGPYPYLQSSFHTGVIAIMIVCQMAVDILTSTIQAKIWRVWVIWSATRYAKVVIVLPSLCFLVFAGKWLIVTDYYSLESMWTLMRVILYPRPVSVAFIEGSTYIQIIAYLLVQYRVASGKAYESQRGQRTLSSLHWNHSNHATTQGANAEINEMDGDLHISESTKREGSEALPVSSMA